MLNCILFILILLSSIAHANDYISTYLDKPFLNKIKKDEIHLIIELGAHHCLDSILLHEFYNCPVIAFECLPVAIEKCKKNIIQYPAIRLVEKAVWNKTGPLDFYYSNGHPAHTTSSSCYQFDYASMANTNQTTVETMSSEFPMERIQVNAVRLDEWLTENNIAQVDMICMDVQGAALSALQGLGEYIKRIKYIITEVEYRPVYIGEPLFPEINAYMKSMGFSCFFQLDASASFSDVLFVRNDLIN